MAMMDSTKGCSCVNKHIAFYNAVYKVPHNSGIDRCLRSTELPVSTCSPGLSTAIHIPQGIYNTDIYSGSHTYNVVLHVYCIQYSMSQKNWTEVT